MMFGKMKLNVIILKLDHSVMECMEYVNGNEVNEIGYEDVRIFCIMIKTMCTLQVDCLECNAAPLLEILIWHRFVRPIWKTMY